LSLAIPKTATSGSSRDAVAYSQNFSGKMAMGRRSATSNIALQRKGEGGQRSETRRKLAPGAALINEPSSEFSGCCCHRSIFAPIGSDGILTKADSTHRR